ncbi:MAG: glycosyltransferase family A protein [Cyclobacteriaceae bacterium]
MNKVKATVIIPTTIDRGILLPYSVGSVQNQTVQDIEIFIIGDGVYDETREVIYDLQSQDDRINFFDHPKHERRGEIYRHMALQEARGEIVCYLCDRDLMLPHHIETHTKILENYDFSSSVCLHIPAEGKPVLHNFFGYFGAYSGCSNDMKSNVGGLSIVAHSLSFYHDQAIQWTTTPLDIPTDVFMWNKFLGNRNCRAFSDEETTILYFKRQSHPGWSSENRLPEIADWFQLLEEPKQIDAVIKQAIGSLLTRVKSIQARLKIIREENTVMRQKLDACRDEKSNIQQEVMVSKSKQIEIQKREKDWNQYSRQRKMLFHFKLALFQMIMILRIK